MNEKKKFGKLTWPTEATHMFPIDNRGCYGLSDCIVDSEVGEVWKIEIVEMTQEEYDALPEFMGP